LATTFSSSTKLEFLFWEWCEPSVTDRKLGASNSPPLKTLFSSFSPPDTITGAMCPSIGRSALACVDRRRARFPGLLSIMLSALSAFEPGAFLSSFSTAKERSKFFFRSFSGLFQGCGSPSPRHSTKM